MHFPLSSRWALRALAAGGVSLAAAVALFVTPRAAAFPPAPLYTIYGVVRDQVGATLRVDGADPLTEFFGSLDKVAALDGDKLALPAHGPTI